MKMIRYCKVVLFWLVLFQCTPSLAWNGTVVWVIDGDSLRVRHNGKIVEIRLYGIDTPEYNQDYSDKAKQCTRRLVYGETVSVEQKDIDRYGRIVALVTSRGKLVNRELVRRGLAWFYPRYCLKQPLCGELKTLENEARTARRGLWREQDPVSPWEWKRRERIEESKSRRKRTYRFPYWR